jgi:murein endopeptidase
LPVDSPAWQVMRLSRNRNWGTPELVSFIERFASDMQQREQWPGLLIGDISQPRGGPMLTGHASHQIGLDVDIWFMPMPREPFSVADRETIQPLLLAEDHGRSVIKENWQDGWVTLLRRAASYPEVARVFVHPAIKKALCQSPLSDKSWQHTTGAITTSSTCDCVARRTCRAACRSRIRQETTAVARISTRGLPSSVNLRNQLRLRQRENRKGH